MIFAVKLQEMQVFLVLSTEVERVGFRESNQIELRGFNQFFANSNQGLFNCSYLLVCC